MLRQPARGRGEHGRRQDQAVGGHHGGIQVQRGEFGLRFGVGAQAGGGTDGKAEPVRRDVHRAFAKRVSAAGGARRLAIDGGDVMASGAQREQRGHGEVRDSP